MDRAQLLRDAKRIVLKVGTSVLADAELRFDQAFFAQLTERVAELQARGVEVLVVSSGAIAAGRAQLKLKHKPKTVAEKQAAAAVGQIQLMRFYRNALAERGIEVAQILLTHGDFQSRKRFLNARQTLLALLHGGIVPLVNENDTVSVEEILVGDNDNLSALVAALVDADLLVLLSDVDGLYTADPRHDPDAERVSRVEDLNQVLAYARDTDNPGSTGGMHTKLQAARHAIAHGIPTLIVEGRGLKGLRALLAGQDAGTLVVPHAKLPSRKHWIAHTLKSRGKLVVDEGALRALHRGGSLLPAGVARVEGHFGPGDPVDVAGADGTPIARGLVSYGAAEVDKLKGKRSSEIEAALGYKTQDEVIHRDHLVLL